MQIKGGLAMYCIDIVASCYYLRRPESGELELQMDFVKKEVADENLVLGTGQDSLQKFRTGLSGPVTGLHQGQYVQPSIVCDQSVLCIFLGTGQYTCISCAIGHG